MTTSIRTLERMAERAIRRILRDAMRDITSIDEFDYAVSQIERVGYARMHESISKTYNAGYISGGNLITRYMRTAAVSEVPEDPLIAQHTTQLLTGVRVMAEAHREEIVEALATYYEKGYTADRIARGMEGFFDDDPIAARRFARTATNTIYNHAHIDRYRDSGVVDGMQISAHIDNVTSDICRMLDGTIYALDDPDMKVPSFHFNCRTDTVPYFGVIPGERDYTKDFSQKFIEDAERSHTTFTSKYWNFG